MKQPSPRKISGIKKIWDPYAEFWRQKVTLLLGPVHFCIEPVLGIGRASIVLPMNEKNWFSLKAR